MFTRTPRPEPQPASSPSAGRSLALQPFQPALTLGRVDDPHERDADRFAQRFVPTLSPPEIQRREAAPPAAGPSVAPEVEAGIQRARGEGQPLPQPLGRHVGSLVRVHADDAADRLSRSLDARAFTVGKDIFFRRGEYDPASHVGQKLIAHELGHVLQQPPSSTVIRRKVGYEIETSAIRVTRAEPPLGKGSILRKGDDYNMTVDEASDGFDLEVVVHELDEQKTANKQLMYGRLAKAMTEVETIIERLKKLRSLAAQRKGLTSEELDLGPKAVVKLRVGGAESKLQATVGLSLEALHLIRLGNPEAIQKQLHQAASQNLEKAELSEGVAVSTIKSALGTTAIPIDIISKHVATFAQTTGLEQGLQGVDPGLAVRLLAAVASMLVEIPLGARLNPYQYPKVTQGKLLHRTDFATILKVLPLPVLQHLKTFAFTWSLYLLDAIDETLERERARDRPHQREFTKQMPEEQYKAESAPSDRRIIGRNAPALVTNWAGGHDQKFEFGKELRLVDWYESMIRREVDLLTKAHYPGTAQQREHIESIGGMHEKHDKAAGNLPLPIFEFRGLPQANGKDQLLSQAMAIWELVRYANSQNAAYAKGMTE